MEAILLQQCARHTTLANWYIPSRRHYYQIRLWKTKTLPPKFVVGGFETLLGRAALSKSTAKILAREFALHSTIWKDETAFTSSLSEIILHPSYQRIIGMGPEVVPLILNDLREESAFWFWALTSITGENPITEEIEGSIEEMRKAWLDWGKQENFL